MAARFTAAMQALGVAASRCRLMRVATLSELQTPLVVIDAPAMTRNIARMAEAAAAGGKRLRPHGKTHKSGWIARQQVAAGAVGLTCAKPGEAEVFAEAGIEDLRIAYPLSPTYAPRVLALMDRVRLSIVVDDLGVAQAWSDVIAARGTPPPGAREDRRGHAPVRRGSRANATRSAFITSVSRMPGLDLRGLLSHAGHSYAASSADDVARIAREEIALLLELVEGCRANDVELAEISVGSTPQALVSATLDGITELRPGNYVFHDRTQVGLGVVDWSGCALRVHASVVVVPAATGSCSTRAARCCRRTAPAATAARPRASASCSARTGSPTTNLLIERLSEEHAVVRVTGRSRLRIGDRVTIVPNHACVVANLTNRYVVADGDTCSSTPIVDARGPRQLGAPAVRRRSDLSRRSPAGGGCAGHRLR